MARSAELLRHAARSSPSRSATVQAFIERPELSARINRHARTDEERTVDDNNWGPHHIALYRVSGTAARATWIMRRGGRWTITEAGRNAVDQFAEPMKLRETARKLARGGDARDEDGDGAPDHVRVRSRPEMYLGSAC
jgi:hypothetical protein